MGDINHPYIIVGGYDKRLKENVEYLEELKSLAEREGVSHRINFITSCSTAERNELLSQCLCVIYTPKVRWHLVYCIYVQSLAFVPQTYQIWKRKGGLISEYSFNAG